MPTSLIPDARVQEADWYTHELAEFGGRVASVIPGGYPAYARILHPATGSLGEPFTWAQVASSAGTVVHPLAQFSAVARRWGSRPTGWGGSDPRQGSLELFQLRILCGILAGSIPAGERCWATVWDGWGNLPARWRDTTPRIEQPDRAYFLFERRLDEIVGLAVDVGNLDGPLASLLASAENVEDAATGHSPAPGDAAPVWVQSPSQWWPTSRTWCVATEVDFDSTLVGGSEALVQEVLSDARLEAFPVSPADDLTIRGDAVNRLPPPG